VDIRVSLQIYVTILSFGSMQTDSCAIVLCSISAIHNEQFFQVGLLDRALISLGLALSHPSTSVSSDFMVLSKSFFLLKLYFTLPCRGHGLLGLALYLLD